MEQAPGKKNKGTKKIIIFLSIILVVLGSIAAFVSWIYEDQVKSIIIGQINKQLIVPVQVKEIKFSLIKDFPKASLSFYGVKAQSYYKGKYPKYAPENLLTAKEINLQFNLLDIFNRNYTITKIQIRGTDLFLYTDQNNNDNYHIWKQDTTSSQKEVAFKLEQISVNNFNLNYKDFNHDLIFSGKIPQTIITGEISGSDFAFITKSDIMIQHLETNKVSYLKNKNVHLHIGLIKKKNVYSFSNAVAEIEKLKLQLSGSFTDKEINFEARGKNLDVQSFISLLPQQYSQKFLEYSSTGSFTFSLSVKGAPTQPQIKANFDIHEATVKGKSKSVALHHLNLKGYYSNGSQNNSKTSGIYINSFSTLLNQSPINGHFSIVDFTQPFINAGLEAVVKLEEVKELLQLDTFNILTGNANLKLNLAGTVEQLSEKDISKMREGQISGTMLLQNASFKLVNERLSYEHIEADIYANDNYIMLKTLKFNHGKSIVELQGELVNFQSLVSERPEKASLTAYFNAPVFELEDWLPEQTKNNTSNPSINSNTYGNRIEMKLKAKIGQFHFEKFNASELNSTIYFKDRIFSFESLNFKTMDGNASTHGFIKLKNNGGFDLTCHAKLQQIDITKLFEQLNNFGQTTLTHKNIAGKLNTEIDYSSSWSNLNNIIPESIIADAKVNISEGQLNNFTPLNKLSKFISITELSQIKFKDLENNVNIQNKKIYIPQFKINSSALNLLCSGTHDFNNNIDYHFQLTLNDLLSKKFKLNRNKNSEFNEIAESEEGKTTLFISMTGHIDNPVIKYDKKELKNFVKSEFKNEKNTIKQLLKEDFGLFKNDKSIQQNTPKKESKPTNFEVEWEESDPPIDKVKTDKKASDKKFSDSPKSTPKREEKEKKKKQKEENSDDFL